MVARMINAIAGSNDKQILFLPYDNDKLAAQWNIYAESLNGWRWKAIDYGNGIGDSCVGVVYNLIAKTKFHVKLIK